MGWAKDLSRAMLWTLHSRGPGGEQEGQMEGLEWQLIKATPTKKAAHQDPHYS